MLTTWNGFVGLLAHFEGCAAPSSRATLVGRLHRSYADSLRTDWDGRGPRPQEATIWYPAEAGSKEVAWKAGVFCFGHGAPDAPFAGVVPHPSSCCPMVPAEVPRNCHGWGSSSLRLATMQQRSTTTAIRLPSLSIDHTDMCCRGNVHATCRYYSTELLRIPP